MAPRVPTAPAFVFTPSSLFLVVFCFRLDPLLPRALTAPHPQHTTAINFAAYKDVAVQRLAHVLCRTLLCFITAAPAYGKTTTKKHVSNKEDRHAAPLPVAAWLFEPSLHKRTSTDERGANRRRRFHGLTNTASTHGYGTHRTSTGWARRVRHCTQRRQQDAVWACDCVGGGGVGSARVPPSLPDVCQVGGLAPLLSTASF